ncbi:MAG: DUF6538 domain-containing protein [Rhizobiaceae bacterium]
MYLTLSRNGVWHFRWPIPKGLHPQGKASTIKVSLRTREPKTALGLARFLGYVAPELSRCKLNMAKTPFQMIRKPPSMTSTTCVRPFQLRISRAPGRRRRNGRGFVAGWPLGAMEVPSAKADPMFGAVSCPSPAITFPRPRSSTFASTSAILVCESEPWLRRWRRQVCLPLPFR